MTADHHAFIAAIRADHDNDSPRLIYADWLDEHGEPERAEFIRLQILKVTDPNWHGFLCLPEHRCKNCRRIIKLESCDFTREEKIFGNRGTTERHWKFVRGFVDFILCASADLVNLDAILLDNPVREVTLTTWPALRIWSSRIAGELVYYASERGENLDDDQTLLGVNGSAENAVKNWLETRWEGIKFTLPSSGLSANWNTVSTSIPEQLREMQASLLRSRRPEMIVISPARARWIERVAADPTHVQHEIAVESLRMLRNGQIIDTIVPDNEVYQINQPFPPSPPDFV